MTLTDDQEALAVRAGALAFQEARDRAARDGTTPPAADAEIDAARYARDAVARMALTGFDPAEVAPDLAADYARDAAAFRLASGGTPSDVAAPTRAAWWARVVRSLRTP